MKNDDLQKFNPYLSNKSDKELYAIRKKLAKRLNQRIRRLESRGIDYGAIKIYKQDVARYYTGNKGFKESLGKTRGISVKHEISLLQNLLNLPTSTFSGIKKIRKKAMGTFENRYNVKFKNVQQYEDFIASSAWKKLDELYGSATALDIIAKSQKSVSEIQKDVESFIAKTDRYTSSDIAKQLGFKSLPDALKQAKSNRK
jgi:predicted HTH transcriptional regulator